MILKALSEYLCIFLFNFFKNMGNPITGTNSFLNTVVVPCQNYSDFHQYVFKILIFHLNMWYSNDAEY